MQSDQYYRTRQWFKEKGDETYNVNFDLDSNSVVFEVGGYQGKWSVNMFNKYHCYLYVFEPVKQFYLKIQEKFKDNPKVKVFNFGLGAQNSTLEFSVDGDASSAFKQGDEQKMKIVDIVDFLKEHKIKHIDLLNINIEGGEYDLLDRLIAKGLIDNIENIQVQFHDFFPDAESRMQKIQAAFSKTHFPSYQFNFVWENWKRKTNDPEQIYRYYAKINQQLADTQKTLMKLRKKDAKIQENLIDKNNSLNEQAQELKRSLEQCKREYQSISTSVDYAVGSTIFKLPRKIYKISKGITKR